MAVLMGRLRQVGIGGKQRHDLFFDTCGRGRWGGRIEHRPRFQDGSLKRCRSEGKGSVGIEPIYRTASSKSDQRFWQEGLDRAPVSVRYGRQGFACAWRPIAQTDKPILPTGIAHLSEKTIALGDHKVERLAPMLIIHLLTH